MIIGRLEYTEEAWWISAEDGSREQIKPDSCLDMEMEGKWIKTRIRVDGDEILFDDEARISGEMVQDMNVKLRMYHADEI